MFSYGWLTRCMQILVMIARVHSSAQLHLHLYMAHSREYMPGSWQPPSWTPPSLLSVLTQSPSAAWLPVNERKRSHLKFVFWLSLFGKKVISCQFQIREQQNIQPKWPARQQCSRGWWLPGVGSSRWSSEQSLFLMTLLDAESSNHVPLQSNDIYTYLHQPKRGGAHQTAAHTQTDRRQTALENTHGVS